MNLDWQAIETVLLDMDGTLLDLHFDNTFWLKHLPCRYAEINNMPEQQAVQLLYEKFENKRGTLEWYCTDYWAQQLNVDVVALKREIQHLIAERPFVEEFLDFLGENGIQRILVTNAHPDSVELKFSVTTLSGKLDKIISSHYYQAPKESPAFWLRLKKEIRFNPEKTLFIDDSETILKTAGDFGIARLLCVRQPDTQQPAKSPGAFPAIHHFDELMQNDQHRETPAG